MTDTGSNPKGAGYGNAITNGAVLQQYEPSVAMPIGTVVDLELYAGPGPTSPPDVPLVDPSSTTPSGRTIGVVVSGDITGTGMLSANTSATVLVLGVCQVLCDADTTAGDPLVQSPATAGTARTSSSPSSRTIGIALESVAIASGTKLVWALINPGTEGGSGGGGGDTLELSYNGTGPAPVQVLDGLAYDPTVGGSFFGIWPLTLNGFGDFPAIMTTDDAGNIISAGVLFSNGWVAFGAASDQQPFMPTGLVIGTTSGNPGNVVGAINAEQGMALVDTTTPGVWVCVINYDPTGPVNAVWDFIASLSITVNDGPVLDGVAGLAITHQPIVNRSSPTLQPLPPMFGFEFPGTVNVAPTLNVDSIPQGIAAGPDRNLWVADSGPTTPGVWRIEPDGTTTEFPTIAGSTPAGLSFTSEGYWWMTDPARQSFWYASGSIYGAGTPTEVSLTGTDAGAQPGAVVTGPDGNAWAIDTRTGGGAGLWLIGENAGPVTTYFPFGDAGTELTGLCAGPDGNLWVADAAGFVWKVTPAGVATSIAVPAGFTPATICTGVDGRLWCFGVEGGDLAVIAFSASVGATISSSGAFGVAGTPAGMISGPGGDLWALDTTGFLWLIPTDFMGPNGGGQTSDVPVSFPTPSTGGTWLCVAQDGTFAISQSSAAGAIWLMPFQMVVPALIVTQGDATFKADAGGPTGPVLEDQSDGHTYRIVSTAGVLSTQMVT